MKLIWQVHLQYPCPSWWSMLVVCWTQWCKGLWFASGAAADLQFCDKLHAKQLLYAATYCQQQWVHFELFFDVRFEQSVQLTVNKCKLYICREGNSFKLYLSVIIFLWQAASKQNKIMNITTEYSLNVIITNNHQLFSNRLWFENIIDIWAFYRVEHIRCIFKTVCDEDMA